jgi:prevent-host-death family protein
MPTTIGVRELKNQVSRVVRTVREEMAEYVITVRDEPVAVLRPLTEDNVQQLRQVEVGEGPTVLESYFDFLSSDDIRIKGTRIGVETVLEDYLEGASPEEIAARYRNLNLEQVYATLLYYFRNRADVDAYLEAGRAYTEQAWLEQERTPSPAIRRLRELKTRRAALQEETITS